SMTSFIPTAILSGVFAALSSVFAKLFSDERTAVFRDVIMDSGYLPSLPFAMTSEMSLITMRVLCFCLIFGCNSLMWTLFTKSLNTAPSSVQVTIVNGAVNFSASAILGFLIFEEPLALRWWVGAGFILAGTIILSQSQKKLENKKSSKKTE
ncbi:hypothetical protein PHYBLDRAFT_119253, partial [Phycomyces blakesleeanus NRRL 1555(-)]